MLQGSIVALVTPMLEDGTVDFKSFRHLVHWHIEQGTQGLVISGSTGESATLSSSEQLSLIEIAVHESRHRVPVIAGTGSNSTQIAVQRTEEAKRAGADACLVVFPYYNRPTFEGCKAHFQKISQCNLPIVVYHNPARTSIRLAAKQLVEISSLPNVIAIKEASGDVDLALELIQSTDKSVFSGEDSLALPLIACGAKGSISIIGNLIPKEWSIFINNMLGGCFEEARTAFQELSVLCKSMVIETNPQCIKYALSLLGKCEPFLRLPLILPQERTKQIIYDVLVQHLKKDNVLESPSTLVNI